jgi:hypothetical protein
MPTVITYPPNEWDTGCKGETVVTFHTTGKRKSELSATVNNRGTCDVDFHFQDGDKKKGDDHQVKGGQSDTEGEDEVNTVIVTCRVAGGETRTCKGTLTVVEVRP